MINKIRIALRHREYSGKLQTNQLGKSGDYNISTRYNGILIKQTLTSEQIRASYKKALETVLGK